MSEKVEVPAIQLRMLAFNLAKVADWLSGLVRTINELAGPSEMDRAIEELNLSVRTFNLLRRDKSGYYKNLKQQPPSVAYPIETIGALTSFSKSDLLRRPGVGRKAIIEIEEELATIGLSLRRVY